jgi:folylpolyglutamate synthase/dihydropteroate synthase
VEAVEAASAALDRALELAGGRALVLVAGSIAFAGEVKMAWENIVGRLAR